MGLNLCARAVAVVLSGFCVAAPLSAASLDLYSFETCRLEGYCRLISQAELDRLRGGFSFMGIDGPINMSFGITQVVYVNNQLVATTQLVVSDIVQAINSRTFSASQIKAANDSLRNAPISAAASSAASSSAAAAAASGTSAEIASNLTSAANQPATKATPAAQTQSVASAQPVSSLVPAVRVNGSPVTPGSPVVNVVSSSGGSALVIQNGPGNISMIPTAQAIQSATNALVIQNTLNNQMISTMTTLNVSMALMPSISAASIQQSVRQAIMNAR